VTQPVPWPDVVARARHLLEERGDAVSDATLGNLRDLADFAQSDVAPPEVGIGYWPTVTLGWDFLAVEIFEDRIEVYPPVPPRKPITVWDEPHRPGGAFTEAFKMAILSAERANRDAIR